jgi:hypothetical protein
VSEGFEEYVKAIAEFGKGARVAGIGSIALSIPWEIQGATWRLGWMIPLVAGGWPASFSALDGLWSYGVKAVDARITFVISAVPWFGTYSSIGEAARSSGRAKHGIEQ